MTGGDTKRPVGIALALVLSLWAAGRAAAAPEPEELAPVSDDTVIDRSVRIRPGTYRIADAGTPGVIQIRGNDLTVDFAGAELVGAPEGAAADTYAGWGVVAVGCRNLTVKNLRARGFKIALYFKECDGLTVTGCDVARNWRQHLKSTPRAEDGADWLFGHDNDRNEWFRYGAGIYVEQSKDVTLARNRARNGQNGICLSRVEHSWIYDNDLSFLSGWGLALWRSSGNEVAHNKLDWCMRGFSYKVYHRGQDSAGILVYEQSCDNVFAYNSATHGGDGFFLFAGKETLERTGSGGCNRNLLYKNDFSHAAANGIEATFSQGNRFIENRLDECDHGVWAGYSYETEIRGNTIRDCTNGVSIEHGHDNVIEGNNFERCGCGVHLWADPNPDFAKTAYGRKVDTKSRGNRVARNIFRGGKVGIDLSNTSGVISANIVESAVDVRSNGAYEKGDPGDRPSDSRPFVPPATHGTQDAFLPAGALRGWRYIFVDDWGPYDFTAPRLFPADVAGWGTAELYLLGPAGDFTVADVKGNVEVTPPTGHLPATLKVAPGGAAGIHEFALEVAVGSARVRAAGYLLTAAWEVKFFGWEGEGAQRPPKDWAAVIARPPLDATTLDRLDFTWGGGAPSPKVPADHFATLATTELELPAGEYEVRTMSDDGVRVRIDDRTVLENWTWHGPTEDKATVRLAAGRHRVRVEHFEIDGHAQLQFWIRPQR